MLSKLTKIACHFLLLACFSVDTATAHSWHVHNAGEDHERVESDAPPGIQEPITFEFANTGATEDPTGLFSAEELEQGGSTVQPPIWYSTFPVDGGEVTLAILVDRWCGAQECPYRFRLEVADGSMTLHSHLGQNYGMICQNTDSISVDPIELTVTACGALIDLKEAR